MHSYAHLDYSEAYALAKSKLVLAIETLDFDLLRLNGPPFDLLLAKKRFEETVALMERMNQTFPFTGKQQEEYETLLQMGVAGERASRKLTHVPRRR